MKELKAKLDILSGLLAYLATFAIKKITWSISSLFLNENMNNLFSEMENPILMIQLDDADVFSSQ